MQKLNKPQASFINKDQKKKTRVPPMASFPTLTIIPSILLTLLIGWFYIVQFHGGDFQEVDKSSGSGGDARPREFDFFKLSLLWPGTSCRNTRKCCSSNACCRGANSPTEFTIHGLWADYNDGTWPACCKGPQFDLKEISTLLDGMNKYWPSFKCSKTSTCHKNKGLFWAHEWEKHGTCSSPVIKDEYDYFIKTLNLYFKYNVTEVLREAGYVESNSEKYPLGGVISAIQNAFHVTPEIQCSGDAVEELRLCFFKDFKLRDCDVGSKSNSQGSCPKYISLPGYVSLGMNNNATETSWSEGKSSI